MTPEPEQTLSSQNETPLQGWKDIAAYLERDERTARRWESEDGLPIRRYRADRRSGVYAYPSEIEAWRASRPVSGDAGTDSAPQPEPQSARQPKTGQPRTWIWSAAAVLLLAGFFYVLRSPELNPFVEAQSGIVTTEIFHGGTEGKVSPDGRYLSATDWGHSGDIGIGDLQTGEYRRLGDKPVWGDGLSEADASIFAPDGQRIAYCWLVGTPEDRWYELRTIEAFSENSKPVVVLASPRFEWIEPEAWTRDGRILVWLRERGSASLAFVTEDSGEVEIVKSFSAESNYFGNSGFGNVALSPDEAWIAYELRERETGAQKGGSEDIFLISSDGQTENQITRHPAKDQVMGFSPDGGTLLFTSDRTGNTGLWGVPVSSGLTTGEPVLLLRDLGDATPLGVLADGSVTYIRSVGSRDLVSAEIDPATGRVLRSPQVIETEHLGSNYGPWYYPDEKRLAYALSPTEIYVRDLETGGETEYVTPTTGLWEGLAWSPDQDRLLARFALPAGKSSLAVLNLADGNLRRLPAWEWETQIQGLGFLNNSETVLYRDKSELGMLQSGESRGERVYPSQPGSSALRLIEAALSPQRDRIAWKERFAPDFNPEFIKVISVGGEDERVLATSEDGYNIGSAIGWSSDGNALIFTRRLSGDPNMELWIAPLDGSEPIQIDLVDRQIRNPALLSDGKTLVYQRGNTDPRIFRTQNFLPAADGE